VTSREELMAASDRTRIAMAKLVTEYLELIGPEATFTILDGTAKNVEWAARRAGRWDQSKFLALKAISDGAVDAAQAAVDLEGKR
jgi:hypothetical protein